MCTVKKERIWQLTDEQAITLFTSPCHYCGKVPTKKLTGIDRIDNSNLAYIDGNVVSCCKMCNYMKYTMDALTFTRKCEHIATFWKLVDGELSPELFGDHCCSITYNSYKDCEKNRNTIFNLTEDQFYSAIDNDCYLCGKSPSKTHLNGLDRVNNNIREYLNNSLACCADCNLMKKNWSHTDFIDQCARVYFHQNDNIFETSSDFSDISQEITCHSGTSINDGIQYSLGGSCNVSSTEQLLEKLRTSDRYSIKNILDKRLKMTVIGGHEHTEYIRKAQLYAETLRRNKSLDLEDSVENTRRGRPLGSVGRYKYNSVEEAREAKLQKQRERRAQATKKKNKTSSEKKIAHAKAQAKYIQKNKS